MLHIASNLELPLDAVTQTFAILGMRGAGKSYTSMVMAEEMLKAGQQVVIVDPIGVSFPHTYAKNGTMPVPQMKLGRWRWCAPTLARKVVASMHPQSTQLQIDPDLHVFPDEIPQLTNRLWAKVAKPSEPDACWLWTGYRTKDGYGSLWFRGRNVYVHRISYALHHGDIPEGQVVCHDCDTPNCVRPDHLFLGTQADNVADMIDKGRQVPPPVHAGESHHNARLTDGQVAEVRQLYATGRFKQRDLATRFGVSQSTIWRIVKGVTRHASDRT